MITLLFYNAAFSLRAPQSSHTVSNLETGFRESKRNVAATIFRPMFALAICTLIGCDNQSPNDNSKAANRASTTDPNYEEARQQLMTLIQDNVVIRGDYSFIVARDMMLGNDLWVCQIKNLTFFLEPEPITEIDRLNQIEWRGNIGFSSAVSRVYYYGSGWQKWSEKKPSLGPMRLVKEKGKWRSAFPRMDLKEYGPAIDKAAEEMSLPKQVKKKARRCLVWNLELGGDWIWQA